MMTSDMMMQIKCKQRIVPVFLLLNIQKLPKVGQYIQIVNLNVRMEVRFPVDGRILQLLSVKSDVMSVIWKINLK